MLKFMKKRSRKSGLPPGTPVYIGEKPQTKTRITIIDYDENRVVEKTGVSPDDCIPLKDTPTVTWINVDGVQELDVLQRLGAGFGLHPLVLEDIMNTDQRPRMEDLGDYIYVVLKMLYRRPGESDVTAEQVSIILGPNFVISFQEDAAGDVFEPIRERIRGNRGRIRKLGADYLVYRIMDAIIDNYFVILETFGQEIEQLEDKVVDRRAPPVVRALHNSRNEMLLFRKMVWPVRELISGLQHTESPLVKEDTCIFLRDVYEHVVQVIDNAETLRELLASLLELYLSSISNRLNEIMKVLAIISTVFMPLTFVAGVYGMNFKFMPEIKSPYGYPAALGVMMLIALGMLAFFRRRKWI